MPTRRRFPHTRVFLNVGSYGEINDYAALRGCHFRQDGLTPTGPSANVGKLYYRPYSRRGVIGNYEFHSGYASMVEKGWDLRTTVNAGLSDPISYMNTNILSPQAWEDAPAEVKQLFVEAARKIGYRFILTKADGAQSNFIWTARRPHACWSSTLGRTPGSRRATKATPWSSPCTTRRTASSLGSAIFPTVPPRSGGRAKRSPNAR